MLHGVSLNIAAGRVTGLLGPSGSGKTTLLRAIVGVQVVESGAVRVLGEPAGAPSVRAQVGYMTQAPAALRRPHRARERALLRRILSAPLARVDEVLATVRLEGLGDRVVRTLSGGEQARASLATALVGRPAVLVLDEPTVGLDPLLRRDLWATFRRLADEGAALLVSSHVMDEAGYCDELVLLREGDILAARPRRAARPDPHRRPRRGLPAPDRASGRPTAARGCTGGATRDAAQERGR